MKKGASRVLLGSVLVLGCGSGEQPPGAAELRQTRAALSSPVRLLTPAKNYVYVGLDFDDGFNEHLWAAEQLNARQLRGTFFIISDAIGKQVGMRGGRLNCSELIQMHDRVSGYGQEIGGHTRSHRHVADLIPSEIGGQVHDNFVHLNQLLGDVASFAYPFGETSTQHEAALRLPITSSATPNPCSDFVRFSSFEHGGYESAQPV